MDVVSADKICKNCQNKIHKGQSYFAVATDGVKDAADIFEGTHTWEVIHQDCNQPVAVEITAGLKGTSKVN